MIKHKLQWFLNRIGKRVLRSKGGKCRCEMCKDSLTVGLVISNKAHAEYLFLNQNELGAVYGEMKK